MFLKHTYVILQKVLVKESRNILWIIRIHNCHWWFRTGISFYRLSCPWYTG